MQMTLYELAYRQDIQDRLRREVEKVLENHEGEVTYESLAEMTYLDQVVNGLRNTKTHINFVYWAKNFF